MAQAIQGLRRRSRWLVDGGHRQASSTVVLCGDLRRRIRLTILADFCKTKYRKAFRRRGSGQGQEAAAGRAQRRPRNVEAHGPRGRNANLLGQNALASGDRTNSGCLPRSTLRHFIQPGRLGYIGRGHGAPAPLGPQSVHAWRVSHDV
jgi:hypothetical protein